MFIPHLSFTTIKIHLTCFNVPIPPLGDSYDRDDKIPNVAMWITFSGKVLPPKSHITLEYNGSESGRSYTVVVCQHGFHRI